MSFQSRTPLKIRALRLGLAGAMSLSLVLSSLVPAQAQRVRVIRDAEIERLIKDYMRPIFRTAGLGDSNIGIVLVNDKSYNAFVADGRRIFINTGVILAAETPNEVIGVLAHETGHISGGHLSNLRAAIARAQTMAILTMLAGIGAAAAGIASGNNQVGSAGAAVAGGASGLGVRSVLSYRRDQELAADRAAIRYLEATGQSGKGMLKTFRRFADQALFSARYADPYVQSHPMPRERISQLEQRIQKSRYFNRGDPAELQQRHDMARAKLSAFTETPRRVNRRFKKNDQSIAARYARAIVAYRSAGLRSALRLIDGLIKEQPNNPYFHELKGQALLENGRARDSIAPLAKAVQLDRNSGLLRILLGHALLESGRDANLKDAVEQLRTGLRLDPEASIGFRHLATAYAKLGRGADADLAIAQGAFYAGNLARAQQHARRAQKAYKRGAPGWLRAEDIITYKPPKLDK
ncbi:MAG: M48 family metallopeptidase [Rhizobiales bacterium]|nr:M48 family metallopeptidase [Hyphomicrobiales bacterium]